MDGIYSACFEVTEKSFFDEAIKLAIAEIKNDWQYSCRKAVEKARRLDATTPYLHWRNSCFCQNVRTIFLTSLRI